MEKPYFIRQVYISEDCSTLYIELHTASIKPQSWTITLWGVRKKFNGYQIRSVGGATEKDRQKTFDFVMESGYWESYKNRDITFVVRPSGVGLCCLGWKETIQLHCGKYLKKQFQT